MTVWRLSMWALLALLAVGVVVVVAPVLLNRPTDPAVDGWPLGAETSCYIAGASPFDDPAYDVAGIAARDLDVPVVGAAIHCYREGTYIVDGKPFIVTRSGFVKVVVFTVVDGSRRAVAVHCGVGCRVAKPPY